MVTILRLWLGRAKRRSGNNLIHHNNHRVYKVLIGYRAKWLRALRFGGVQ